MMRLLKAKCVQFWETLSDRDRYALCIGVLSVMLYLAYMMHASLRDAVSDNTQRLVEKQATLAWVAAAEARFTPGQQKKKKLEGARGLTIFSNALNQTDLQALPYELQQLEAGGLQLSFDAVPYPVFLNWLWSMEQRYVLTVQSFSVEKTETPGLVRLTIILML